MKVLNKIVLILTLLITIFIISPVNVFASDINSSSIIINDNDFLNTAPAYMYLAAADNTIADQNSGTSSDSKSDSQINWHKVLGWSTLGMMAVTIGSGFVIPDGGHCALAGVTTGLAVVTCADGIYEYGGLISLADGDWKYNTHAIMGVLATAGFITTLVLADGGAHVATGIASGAAFTIALGVIYF